ncbi:MAG: STAS domain-containing protein [Desulfobacteraceae bacterium]|jgi:anti-anti-sigma factor
MGHIKKSKENNNTIKINGPLSIYEAVDIHKKLLHSLAENNKINIDLGDVDSCDVAGLQLLISAIKTGEKEEKQITISNVSETFQKTAKLVGLQYEIFIGSNGEDKSGQDNTYS